MVVGKDEDVKRKESDIRMFSLSTFSHGFRTTWIEQRAGMVILSAEERSSDAKSCLRKHSIYSS